MAYTFPWNAAVPAGTDPANQLDTNITDFKGALAERMESVFINSMAADPWVVKPAVLGNVTGKIYPIHHSAGTIDPATTPVAITDQYFRNDSNTAEVIMRMPVTIPHGCTIQEFRMFLAKGTANTVAKLMYGSYDGTFTTTTIATLTRANTAIGEETALALNHLVDLTVNAYFIQISIGRTAGKVSIGHIIYDTPDCRNTR